MSLRFGKVYDGGYYHVFNRGVDKRVIFHDQHDVNRFLLLLNSVNTQKPIRSIKDLRQQGDIHEYIKNLKSEEKLVNILAYSLVSNHFHFIIQQNTEKGMTKFMQRLTGGYSQYYNHKYKREGTLFSGRYKYIEIAENKKLIRLICYVNSNHEIHGAVSEIKYVSGVVDVLSHSREKVVEREKIFNLFGSASRYAEISEHVIESIVRTRDAESDELLE